MSKIIFESRKQPNGSTLHVLKCLEPYYFEVYTERKTFEIRKDDREFEYTVGDSLALYQVVHGVITGNYVIRKVTYVLRFAEDYGLKPGYVILSIK